MKKFYSFLDASLIEHCPQPLQHLANSNMAAKNQGLITFYGAEDIITVKDSKVLKAQLSKDSDLEGIVFFSINQFRFDGILKLELIREVLNKNLEIHFSRENLSIKNIQDLEQQLPLLVFLNYSLYRDQTIDYRKKIYENYHRK